MNHPFIFRSIIIIIILSLNHIKLNHDVPVISKSYLIFCDREIKAEVSSLNDEMITDREKTNLSKLTAIWSFPRLYCRGFMVGNVRGMYGTNSCKCKGMTGPCLSRNKVLIIWEFSLVIYNSSYWLQCTYVITDFALGIEGCCASSTSPTQHPPIPPM